MNIKFQLWIHRHIANTVWKHRIRILNTEWAVYPLPKNDAATADVVTAVAFRPRNLRIDWMTRMLKIFPVLPVTWRKYSLLRPNLYQKGLVAGSWGSATVNLGKFSFKIELKTYAWSLLNFLMLVSSLSIHHGLLAQTLTKGNEGQIEKYSRETDLLQV